MGAVFFSRCKPQDADTIDLVLEHQMVFIGWPLSRPGSIYDPHALSTCVVSPASLDEEWWGAHSQSRKSRGFNKNRNLVRAVDRAESAIVMVPRPDRGVIYCGRVCGSFQLINDPPWYKQYLTLRERQGLSAEDGPDTWHAADVAQGWKVEQFEPVPVLRIPAWIRRSLFGRSTYNLLKADASIGVDPFPELEAVLKNPLFIHREWTLDPGKVGRRMVTDLTPSTFEHLVVSLLQLEDPSAVWSQVGGSGDGGVDGIAIGSSGTVTSILQCKWQYWGGDPFGQTTLLGREPVQRCLAVLRHPAHTAPPAGVRFLDREGLAKMVIDYRARLPQALSMRVGP